MVKTVVDGRALSCCWACPFCKCLFQLETQYVDINDLLDPRDKNAWEMDEAGLRRWNELLEHATALALDEGHDEDHAHIVLSALATSIASHNHALLFSPSSSPNCNSDSNAIKSTPVSSPPTRLADLLLSSLISSFQTGSCAQLPQSVLEFVNDAMHESYPPRPRDSVVFLWTARSVTGVVETCPRELIECLLGGGGIGEGVGVWIADECKAWSIAQLGYDVSLVGPLSSSVLNNILDHSVISNHPHPDPGAPTRAVHPSHIRIHHCLSIRWSGRHAFCCEGCI